MEDQRQQLENLISKILKESNLFFGDFMYEIDQVGGEYNLTLEDFEWLYKQIIKIIKKEKHRDQLVELLDENFDLPQYILKEMATKIDDKVLSPIQKYIKNYDGEFTEQKQKVEIEIPTRENVVKNEVTKSPDQQSEIEKLKEKIRQLEQKQWQNVPQTQPKTETYLVPTQTNQPPHNLPVEPKVSPKRYGVAPARDLGTADFDWQGNVGGVEIEKTENENGLEEENLSKAQILEEVEHPPVYTASTSFEKRLGQTKDRETNFATEIGEPKKPEKNIENENVPAVEIAKGDIEEKRKEVYREGDPYREPIE